ncbi:hypothetical protein Q3G72_001187 [Acer saccharum]|nr:hypothetical protein Q3G72_001187 [Acer saccharum]
MRCLVPVFDSDFPSLDPMDCKVESIREQRIGIDVFFKLFLFCSSWRWEAIQITVPQQLNARLHSVDSVKCHRPLLRETTLFPFIQTLTSYQEPLFIALPEVEENDKPTASQLLLFKPLLVGTPLLTACGFGIISRTAV